MTHGAYDRYINQRESSKGSEMQKLTRTITSQCAVRIRYIRVAVLLRCINYPE